MEKWRSILKYVFIFLFAFLAMSVFMTYVDGDVLWNYGFSYAISQGEIPYIDFNMILPPAYSFLMALGLFFNPNILVFYLENSLLITFIFYFLFKLYGKKAWIFLLFLIFPIPVIVYPSYNLLLLFLLIVLFYLEKNNGNDYLIGVILGLMVFTKQTVGVAIFLVGLLYYFWSDRKKLFKRLIGFLAVCVIFLIYFLVAGSLYQFFNHCLFGLLDFTGKNGNINSAFFGISLLLLGIVIFLIVRDKKAIYNWYLLAFFTVVIPLFDIGHLSYFVFSLLLVLLMKDFSFDKRVIKYYIFFCLFYMIFFFYNTTWSGFIYPNHYYNFNYRVLYNKSGENEIRDEVVKFINENKRDQRIVILGSDAYFYKITCHMRIDHFDLLNYGNHGWKGEKKLREKFSKLPSGTIILVDSRGNGKKNAPQFMTEFVDYAVTMGEEIDEIGGYVIYKKK